jgi:tRNA-dihydrouridine synthase
VHSRKCFLNGLTPKQNRDVPPLKYEVVHRLVQDFPELTFILNGGITTLDSVDTHLFGVGDMNPPVHGVMIGRAVYNDPYLLSTVDSRYYGRPDPCLTRRQVMERYLDHCDKMQAEDGPVKDYRGQIKRISPSVLVKSVHNAFVGCDGNSRYRNALNQAYLDSRRKDDSANARLIVSPSKYFSIYHLNFFIVD